MTIPEIRDVICSEIGYILEKKITSMLHRVKNKETPNQEILTFLEKRDFYISDTLLNFIKNIDFSNLRNNKHGGRGEDKKRRRGKGEKRKGKGWRDYHSMPDVDECNTWNW